MNEVLQLAIPLSQSQIDAAAEFWKKNGGAETPDVFSQIRKAFPGLSEAVTVKAIVLNELYGTNIIAIQKVADCVEQVLKRDHSTGPELVEELVTEIWPITKQHNHSFASKYAHFFIDSTLPILDWYAEWMLGLHLGRSAQFGNGKRYLKFAEDVETLKMAAGLQCSCAELDGYLWMVGEYRYWKAHPKTQVNAELRLHFEALETSPEAEPDLAKALG